MVDPKGSSRIWVGYEKRDHIVQNTIFWQFSNTTFQGLKSPRLPTWNIGSIDLLLHISSVRNYSKPPVRVVSRQLR